MLYNVCCTLFRFAARSGAKEERAGVAGPFYARLRFPTYPPDRDEEAEAERGLETENRKRNAGHGSGGGIAAA
jgi:hypothetical protein